MSSGSVRLLRHMLWMRPGRPRKWSPWKWVRKTRRTRMNDADDWKNWRCVPSPQSRRMSSFSASNAIALADRSLVGHEPAVPRKVRRIGQPHLVSGKRPLGDDPLGGSVPFRGKRGKGAYNWVGGWSTGTG